MKLFFTINDENKILSFSNIKMQESNGITYEFEVDETDEKLVNEGVKDWVIVDGQLSTVDSNKKQLLAEAKQQEQLEQEQKNELKNKLESGEASLEEIQKLLAKLL